MHSDSCHHCGYDLTGLSRQGRCPECGRPYDADSTYRSTHRGEHPLSRYAAPIGLGALALLILVCGGLLSLAAKNPGGMVIITLFVAALPAFGAFAYWWSDRAERRGSD